MGNKIPPPDARVVYLALKNVFTAQMAEVRQPKVISKAIKNHEAQDPVADLLREHSFDMICTSARDLLQGGVFASTLKAKIRFPELFDLSPVQSAEKDASEAEAAKHEAEAVQHAVQGRWDITEPTLPGLTSLGFAIAPPDVPETEVQTPRDRLSCSQSVIPPIFPLYLPTRARHKLLVHLQNILEVACYDFGKRTLPEVLQQRDWDCAEAVELNRWTDVLNKRQDVFAQVESIKKPLRDLFISIANIRHTAVHRIQVNVKGIEQFFLDAETLAVIMEETECAEKIAKLRRETQVVIEELQRNKILLHSKLDETLRGLASQREKLKRLEEMAIIEMGNEDDEYQALAGKSIEEIIEPSEASFLTAIETEQETVLGIDTDGTEEDDDDLGSPDEA